MSRNRWPNRRREGRARVPDGNRLPDWGRVDLPCGAVAHQQFDVEREASEVRPVWCYRCRKDHVFLRVGKDWRLVDE